MSKDFDNTNRGALFKNADKQDDSHSDYNGSINIEGQEYWLNAWLKTSKAGVKYMSLSVKSKQPRGAPQSPKATGRRDDFEDDVPW